MRLWRDALLATAALALAAEAALRVAGFQYSHTPISLRYAATMAHIGHTQTGHRRTFHIDYALDPVMLWRPIATAGVTNSRGFLGPEWPLEKPPGGRRVITLGDSCTIAGEEPYPRLLQKGLPAWEVLNAGVGSWSSYQGLKLLETGLLRYRPDVVTIYFGWNDHWLAWAAQDKDLAALLNKQWRLRTWIAKSRLLQALLKLATAARGGPVFTAATPFRVSLEDYETNLRRMAALVRAAGGVAVLVTAPTSLSPKHPVTLALCRETHNFYDPALINSVHAAYNERVRKASRDEGLPLVDLERAFAARPRPELLFDDGIHLSALGHRLAAQALAGEIGRIVRSHETAPPP